jgi:hypothetical protein
MALSRNSLLWRRSLRRLWMRGFLPALLLLLLWGFSSGLWIIWQGSGPAPPRAVLGRGVVLVNWDAPATSSGFGTVRWSLGVLNPVNGQPVSWYVDRPLWSITRVRIEWRPVLRNGHLQVPLYLVALLAAIPPGALAIRRARRLQAWQCPARRHNPQGVPSAKCPECGKAIAKV